jgi:hypothetical protein
LVFAPETNRTLKSGYCKSHMRTKILKVNSSDGEHKEVHSENSRERINERYSTVIRGTKTFSSHIASGEWALLVEQQTRWTLKDANTPFAVVITVEDPHQEAGIDIRAGIRNEASVRYQTELHTAVRARV